MRGLYFSEEWLTSSGMGGSMTPEYPLILVIALKVTDIYDVMLNILFQSEIRH